MIRRAIIVSYKNKVYDLYFNMILHGMIHNYVHYCIYNFGTTFCLCHMDNKVSYQYNIMQY